MQSTYKNEIDLFLDKFLECVEQSKLNEITIIFSDFNIGFFEKDSIIIYRFVNQMKTVGRKSSILNYKKIEAIQKYNFFTLKHSNVYLFTYIH